MNEKKNHFFNFLYQKFYLIEKHWYIIYLNTKTSLSEKIFDLIISVIFQEFSFIIFSKFFFIFMSYLL